MLFKLDLILIRRLLRKEEFVYDERIGCQKRSRAIRKNLWIEEQVRKDFNERWYVVGLDKPGKRTRWYYVMPLDQSDARKRYLGCFRLSRLKKS